VDRDEITNKRLRLIAEDHGCTVAEVHGALDAHPIELDRDQYLKCALALQWLQLDALEVAFGGKAFVDPGVAAGMLLVKVTPGDLVGAQSAAWPCGSGDRARSCGGTKLDRADPRGHRPDTRPGAARAESWVRRFRIAEAALVSHLLINHPGLKPRHALLPTLRMRQCKSNQRQRSPFSPRQPLSDPVPERWRCGAARLVPILRPGAKSPA
jgi:hypothetical protein